MKSYASTMAPLDFKWPEGDVTRTFSSEELQTYGVPETDAKKVLDPVELVFKTGQAPPPPQQ
jgi:hypothetical protein